MNPKPADATATSGEVEQGRILWLPSLEEVLQSSDGRGQQKPVVEIATGINPSPNMYNHPILVFSRPANNPDMISFLVITSFRQKSLQEITQGIASGKKKWKLQTFVPLANSPAHPFFEAGNERYRNLTLDGVAMMEKQGYVNARAVYRMDWRDAERYWGADAFTRRTYKLDEASIRRVLALTALLSSSRPSAQYRPDEVHSTPVLTSTCARITPQITSSTAGVARIDAYPPFMESESHSPRIDQPTPGESGYRRSRPSIADETGPLLGRDAVLNPDSEQQSQTINITAWLWRWLKWTGLKSMTMMKFFVTRLASVFSG